MAHGLAAGTVAVVVPGLEYAAKAATVGMLVERTKMEYTTRAGTADGGDGGALPGPPAGLNLGQRQSFCCQCFC